LRQHVTAHYYLLFFISSLTYYSVSAAAARVKHPAGHSNIIFSFMILSFVYYVMPAAATCFRHSAHDSGHYDFISYFIYLLFSACIGSMREAFCGSMRPPIIIFIYYYESIIKYCTQPRALPDTAALPHTHCCTTIHY